jgi:hypothetical protein
MTPPSSQLIRAGAAPLRDKEPFEKVEGSLLIGEMLLESLTVELEVPADELRVMCSDHRGDLL